MLFYKNLQIFVVTLRTYNSNKSCWLKTRKSFTLEKVKITNNGKIK